MSLTRDIKEYALEIGYQGVGITAAEGFPDYAAELESRREMYRWYIESARRPLVGAHPKSIMPEARSIVSLVYDYAGKAFPENLTGKIGRLYQSRCYTPPEGSIAAARNQLMRTFLEKAGCVVGRGIVIPERLTAAQAGIVTYGKNCFAFAGEAGSFITLSSFVVDAALEVDEPTFRVDCPEGCSACIDACPTRAIYAPLKMNPLRCIAFNSFWAQDGVPGVSACIPPDIREKMGSWIHGCDLCQEACPRNQRRMKATLPRDPFLEEIAADFDLSQLLEMSDSFYRRRVKPLMYNYIREGKYFQRNAAIAMGNSGDPAYIPALARAIEGPEALVRAYAAWALGRIGGPRSRQLLDAAQAREIDPALLAEIKAALAMA